MKLSILDFGEGSASDRGSHIIQRVTEYAKLADQLGYERFWLSEHHSLSPAWNNPEVLLPLLAERTQRIRLGVAGIVLSLHSPYRVALTFKLLNTICNDRIDLGLANGGACKQSAQLMLDRKWLRNDFRKEFFRKCTELTSLYQKKYQADLPPCQEATPSTWLLTSSCNHLDFTAKTKLHLALSLFHKKVDLMEAGEKIQKFKEDCEATYNFHPQITVAVAGIWGHSRTSAMQMYQHKYNTTEIPTGFMVGCSGYFEDRLNTYRETLGVTDFVFKDLATCYQHKLYTLEAGLAKML